MQRIGTEKSYGYSHLDFYFVCQTRADPPQRSEEHLHREKQAECAEAAEEAKKIMELGRQKRKEKEKAIRDIDELKSQQGQMLGQLKKINPDAARGWDWLRENQSGFEKEVFGPPMLNCTVKDKRYSDLVQASLGQDDFMCFTTQTREDHKKLSQQFYRELGLSVTIRTCLVPYNSFQHPMPRARLAEYGLDGYVSNYIEGPEPVLAMLCSSRQIHAAAVGLAPVTAENLKRIHQDEVISSFAAGKESSRIVRRREYGPSAVTTRTNAVLPGRFWTDHPVDLGASDELKQNLDRLLAEFDELRRQNDEKVARHGALKEEAAAMEKKIVRRSFLPVHSMFSIIV
jgi:structural maintenance of chromosomes protein 5